MLSDDPSGALAIGTLDADGPAAKAGLQVGDVIESIGGIAVLDVTAVSAALAGDHPGDTVTITVKRAGADVSVDVVVAAPRSTL
jgi:S1-C subfamily serine protease